MKMIVSRTIWPQKGCLEQWSPTSGSWPLVVCEVQKVGDRWLRESREIVKSINGYHHQTLIAWGVHLPKRINCQVWQDLFGFPLPRCLTNSKLTTYFFLLIPQVRKTSLILISITVIQVYVRCLGYFSVYISCPKTCICTLTADSPIDVSFLPSFIYLFISRLSFEQRKSFLKCYWEFENAVEIQTLPL